MSESRALVLVARPTPAGIDERSLGRLAAAVAARTSAPVRVGYLDQVDPSVPAVLDALEADGVGATLLVPLAVPADRYLTTWIAKAAADWRERRRPTMQVRMGPSLTDLVADVVAALSRDDVERVGEEITASPAGFRSPSWSVLDVPDRHLWACRGPRCLVHGAGATLRALAAGTRNTRTQVTPVGCLGPCNLGPLVVESPGGVWHQHVDVERAAVLAAPAPQAQGDGTEDR